ncbi:MAG: HPr family phosphocarrier protein [Planctomycetia bacterium]|nr:HPr family phosphocarrier protein [Planctomycetia bacterium]
MKLTRELTVKNQAGFHLRVASMISKLAMNVQSEVFLTFGSYKADCKSCFDLLAVMAPCGSVLTLDVEGDDAIEIADTITDMFEKKFFEDEFAPQET